MTAGSGAGETERDHPDTKAMQIVARSIERVSCKGAADEVINDCLNSGVVFRMARWPSTPCPDTDAERAAALKQSIVDLGWEFRIERNGQRSWWLASVRALNASGQAMTGWWGREGDSELAALESSLAAARAAQEGGANG